MYQFAIHNRWKQLLAICLSSCFTYNVANALTLPDGPLSTSAGSPVPPNVMLQLDNSGSMKNLMWHSGFDLMGDYGDWSNSKWTKGKSSSFSNLPKDVSNSSYVVGTKSSVTYKLLLPTPHGTNTSYEGNYLNYLFWYADTNNKFVNAIADITALTDIPQNSRMQAAQSVAKKIVNDNKNADMRFGLFSFNGKSGGILDEECKTLDTTSRAALNKSIDDLVPSSSTPLAETYFDIVKYFRGTFTNPGESTKRTSPIEYRCQKNFAIVVTDGLPNGDNKFTITDEPTIPSGRSALPDYDGKSPWYKTADPTKNITVSSFPDSIPQWSDGDGSKKLYLDDLALYGYETDLRTASNGKDKDNESYDAPDFPKQNLIAHTIGLATDNQMLKDAAGYMHANPFNDPALPIEMTKGLYKSTASEIGLSDAIQAALDSFKSSAIVRSISNIATNSTSLTGNTEIYQATYQGLGNDWTGSLTATPIDDTDFTLGTVASFSVPGTRYIYSLSDTDASTIIFNDSGVTATQKPRICIPDCVGSDTATTRINYLRGVQSNELSSTEAGGLKIYRDRSSILGDIINSAPTYVGAPAYRYTDHDYQGFKNDNSDRPGILYVGANDGMLHAFDTSSPESTTYREEIMAYVPNAVMGKLGELTQPDYTHKYFVDGSPTTGDAYYGSAWHTVLATGLNKGGKAIIGMDITDPTDFSNSTLKAWEFTDDADLGFTYSQPAIVKMKDGSVSGDDKSSWTVVFGNGYNSESGKANLFVGTLSETGISTGMKKLTYTSDYKDTPNGLASVAPVDLNGDNKIDVIYAGDLFGNLLKFNVSSETRDDWSVSVLFSTCASQPCSQAITVRPEVGLGPKTGSVMVYFGTGKILEDTDPADTSLQSFYAILDESLINTTTVIKENLVQQKILGQFDTYIDKEGDLTDPNNVSGSYRTTSAESVNYGGANAKKGWYINLQYNNVAQGERVVTNPILRNGRIIFTTNYYGNMDVANDKLCTAANDVEVKGGGWIMELNALNGSRLPYSPFDTNNDGTIDSTDLTTSGDAQLAVSGKKVSNNIGEPLILTYGGREIIVNATNENNADDKEGDEEETLDITVGNGGPANNGRQGWVQIK